MEKNEKTPQKMTIVVPMDGVCLDEKAPEFATFYVDGVAYDIRYNVPVEVPYHVGMAINDRAKNMKFVAGK